jgi:hypothetical protein
VIQCFSGEADALFLISGKRNEISKRRMTHKVISGECAAQKMVSGTTGVLTRAGWSLESRQSLESTEMAGSSS